jgi:hypothetical protein
VAVKKKSAAKKAAPKKSAKRAVKKSAAKKSSAKKTTKKSAKRAVKKSAAKKSSAKKSATKKSATKKSTTKKSAKRAVKKSSARKSATSSRFVVPPVPVSGSRDRVNVTTAPTPNRSFAPASSKPSAKPMQGTSSRVVVLVVLGIVLLAALVLSNGKKSDDAAAPTPTASESAAPTESASATPTESASQTSAPVGTVEAPGRFIGNWGNADHTVLNVTWKAPAATDGLTGYKVETRINRTEWKVVAELPATQLSQSFTKSDASGETAFRVSAVYSDGQAVAAKAFGFAGQFE